MTAKKPWTTIAYFPTGSISKLDLKSVMDSRRRFYIYNQRKEAITAYALVLDINVVFHGILVQLGTAGHMEHL